MSNFSISPWVKRFHPFMSEQDIFKAALFVPSPLENLAQMMPEDARGALKRALEATYYPTEPGLKILERLLGIAWAHSKLHYEDTCSAYGAMQLKEVKPPHWQTPICLSGLSGCGKSSLLQALSRILPSPEVIQLPDDVRCLMESHRILQIQPGSNANHLLASLDSGGRGTVQELVSHCRRLLFRNGIALLGVDESQFATTSQDATVQTTKILMSMCNLRVPVVYVANYSLVTKLKRRPQEERHRLLADYIHMEPLQAGSADWIQTLALLRSNAPDYFSFEPSKDEEEIHHCCFGLLRPLKELLMIAFARAHERNSTVGLEEIREAYRSEEYAIYRMDIEQLFDWKKTGRQPKMTGLMNPLPSSYLENRHAQTFSLARKQAVAEAALQSAMPKHEQEKEARAPLPPTLTPVPRKAKTAENLTADLRSMLQTLPNKKPDI